MQENDGMKVTWLKLSLYLISLWILLFMLIVLKADLEKLPPALTVKEFIKKNIVPFLSIILIMTGIIGYISFLDILKNVKHLPVQVESVESINYENLSFLATYIIPLVCFPMNSLREIAVLFFVILIIGCIFVKTNLYYTNPSLVLLGFNVYKVNCKSSTNAVLKDGIVIIKGKITAGDTIRYLSLSDNVHFARRIRYENERVN